MNAAWLHLKKLGAVLCDGDTNRSDQARLAIWVLGAAFIVFLTLLSLSPDRLLYDEPWYLATTKLARESGFISSEFLLNLPGPAGPLYTWYHLLFSPLTELRPHGVRLVTALALVLAVGLTCGVSVVSKDKRLILFFIGVTCQFAWVLGGMALTEAPAMLCAAAAFRFWDQSLRPGLQSEGYLLSGFAGFALGLAVLGRQPYALLGLVIGLGALRNRAHFIHVLIMGVICLSIVLPVFSVWGGIVPPFTAYVSGGFQTRPLILAFGYGGMFIAATAPRFFVIEAKVLISAVILAALSYALHLVSFLPMVSVFRSIGNEQFVDGSARVFGSVLVGVAVFVLVSCVVQFWRQRDEVVQRASILAVVMMLIGCGFVGHQFSSRYVGAALPLLLVLIAAHVRPGCGLAIRTAITALIGFLSLASYYEYL